MKKSTLSGIFIVLALAACDLYPPTPHPDYTIHVVSTPQGDVAVPPTCASYVTAVQDPFDNQPQPQFGCATARNLALSVERPSDLVQGRELGPERGVNAVGSIRRYDNNQTRGLIDPESSTDSIVSITTAPVSNSPMTGDITGGQGSTSSGSSATPSSTPSTSGSTSGP